MTFSIETDRFEYKVYPSGERLGLGKNNNAQCGWSSGVQWKQVKGKCGVWGRRRRQTFIETLAKLKTMQEPI